MSSTTQIRYHGTQSKEHETLLEVVDMPRLRASRDRDFADYRWIDSEVEQLADFQYWAPTHKKKSPLLIVDLDNEYEHDLITSFAATPNWIGINRKNHHSQLIYYLGNAVYGEASPARRYYNAVARHVTFSLGGDPHFTRYMARNPFDVSGQYEWHAQHDGRYSLDELEAASLTEYDGVTARKASSRSNSLVERTYDAEGLQRRTLLWNTGRFEGYRLRGLGYTVEYDDIRAVLDPLNAEIAATDDRGGRDERTLHDLATHISRWCNEYMIPGTGNGGGLFTREQCVRGGQRGGQTQGAIQGPKNVANGTMGRMREGSQLTRSPKSVLRAAEIRIIHEQDPTLTHTEIAALVGVKSTKTVQRALKAES